jgi:hypothetical protein
LVFFFQIIENEAERDKSEDIERPSNVFINGIGTEWPYNKHNCVQNGQAPHNPTKIAGEQQVPFVFFL